MRPSPTSLPARRSARVPAASALAALWPALLALALAAAVRAEPLQTLPRDQFFRVVRTVAIESCRFPEDFGLDDTLSVTSDSAARWIEANLTAQFERAGIRVIPASAYTRHFAAGADSAGTLYDPFTGEVDAELALQLVGRAHAAVAATDTVDAWVLPRVMRVAAPFQKGEAKWSGRAEVFDLEREKLVPSYKRGEAPALTLVVTVEAPDGQALYRNEGGLQLTSHVRDQRIVPLPASAWLRDPRSVGWAVELAVWPLLTSSPKWNIPR